MTWEEYQSTDAYRESHRDERTKKEREEDLLYKFMKRYMEGIEEWNKRDAEARADGKRGADEDFIDAEGRLHHVIYFVLRKYQSRTTGCITCGDFKHCWKAVYDYNVSCISSEWDWATLEREEIVVADAKELDEEIEAIIEGYRELNYCDPFDVDDY